MPSPSPTSGAGGMTDPQFVSPKLCMTEAFDNTYYPEDNFAGPRIADSQHRNCEQFGGIAVAPPAASSTGKRLRSK
jgi:hypothetical protein